MKNEEKGRKTVVITGASDGIGAAAAKKLVSLGHRVVIVGRNPEKTKNVAKSLGMPYHVADFSRFPEVVRLAKELSAYGKIDVLCNNAGGIRREYEVTEDGNEMTEQVNVLSPFLLTELLSEKLCRDRATVVFTASIAADLFVTSYVGRDADRAPVFSENYDAFPVYGHTKLDDVLLTREFACRYEKKGMNAVAFEPGIVRSNFGETAPAFVRWAYRSPLRYVFSISPETSAERMVRLALGTPGKDFRCGRTYHAKKEYIILYRDKGGRSARALWRYCAEKCAAVLAPGKAGE